MTPEVAIVLRLLSAVQVETVMLVANCAVALKEAKLLPPERAKACAGGMRVIAAQIAELEPDDLPPELAVRLHALAAALERPEAD